MESQPTLQTDRLVLRPFELADAEVVQRLAGDARVALTTGDIPYPYEDGLAQKWISTHKEAWEEKSVITYAVCSRNDSTVIGCTGLRRIAKHSRASLGYWIGYDDWGKGYCTEAARAVIDLGFDRLHLKRIEATHLLSNGASGAVMKKLGMEKEGIFREYMIRDGISHDVAQFAILATDWKLNTGLPSYTPFSGTVR